MIYETKILKSIHDIPSAEWDIMSEDVFSSSAWLGLCEDMRRERSTPNHILLYKDETLIAALPAYILEWGMFFDLSRFFSKKHILGLKLLGIGHSPIMISLFPINFRTGLLSRSDLSDHEVNLLLERFEKEAKKRKIHHVVFLYVTERQTQLRSGLTKNQYKECYFSSRSYIPIDKYDRFEDYVSSIAHKRRSQVRKEIKKFKKSGIRMVWSDELIIPAKTCVDQMDIIFQKYGTQNEYTPEFFEEMSKRLKGKAQWLFAFKNDVPVAWLISVLNPGALDQYKFGVDYETTKGSATFFNLMFYEPVRRCIEMGYPELNLGMSAIKTKKLRSALSEEIYAYIKCLHPIGNQMLKASLARKDAYYRENPP